MQTRMIGKSNRSAGTTPEKIRNVGPRSTAWLKQVGIRAVADIRAIGAFAAFLKVRRAGFKATLSLVYALAGAEDDCHWQTLNPERKAVLLAQFQAFEIEQKAARKRFGPPGSSLGSTLVAKALGSSDPDFGGGGSAD